MAKSKETTASKNVPERYPRFEIVRDIASESYRWNIGTIIWYKRLIDATIGLILIAFAALIMAAVFAYRQPLPRLYASAIDGPLYSIPYSGAPNGKYFDELRSKLILEQKDLVSLGGGSKAVITGKPAAAAQATPSAGSQPPAPLGSNVPSANPVGPSAVPSQPAASN